MDNIGFRIKSKGCRRIFVPLFYLLVITIQKILFLLLHPFFFFFMQNLTGTEAGEKC